jgi:hypothetical protein
MLYYECESFIPRYHPHPRHLRLCGDNSENGLQKAVMRGSQSLRERETYTEDETEGPAGPLLADKEFKGLLISPRPLFSRFF